MDLEGSEDSKSYPPVSNNLHKKLSDTIIMHLHVDLMSSLQVADPMTFARIHGPVITAGR